jgi:hypothetical protein
MIRPALVPPQSPIIGLCCQALVSFGPSSIPIKDSLDGFPTQPILRPERGVRDFRMLARIGDDFFVALANLFERKGGVSHDLPRCLMIRTSIIAPRGAGSRQGDTHPNSLYSGYVDLELARKYPLPSFVL